MLKKFFIILILLSFPYNLLANTDTGVQARVLPENKELLLDIVDWSYENKSAGEVAFYVKTNLPANVKIEYGTTWQKGQMVIDENLQNEHHLLLRDLKYGTLYYFNISAFNDNDSISLGDNTIKTLGTRKVLDKNKELIKKEDSGLIGSNKKVNISPYPEENYNYKSDELFLLEDLSVLFIIFSLLLVLLLIYKALKNRNKRKEEHWEKLDKS